MKKILLLSLILLNLFYANSQVFINEVFATNASTNLDTKYYNFSGWAELYNAGTADVEMGSCYFSDEKANKSKWKLPSGLLGSKQFAIFWFNEMDNANFTNFKLNAKGAELYLFQSDGSIVDSIAYPKQYPNISYARYPDGSYPWQYNMQPTINAANSVKAYSSFTSLPVFSQSGGLFSSSLNITINTNNSGAEIRYTLNGSEPKQSSILYSSAIPINKTTIIRAKVFEPGYLPSEIVTQSYIFPNHHLNLPAYSLTTDSVNLWDNMMGMYVAGSNGITDYCSNGPRNYNQDWERPFNLEFFDTSGTQRLNQYLGLKIAGHCSRDFAQKSFSIIPRNIYGKGKLKYRFFKDKSITEFERIFLRNSGNDWGIAFLRDVVFNALVKNKMDIDYDAYQPSVIYLNGNYWGMLDTREKMDERYIMSNYNLSENQFDMLENNISVLNGSPVDYTNLLNFVSLNNLGNKTNYDYVKSMMDVNEYINYMITEIYIGNTDWPGNNLKYWRSNLSGGKWRWILTDLDFGFGIYDKNINHNTLQFALATDGPDWPNPPWSTLLFRKLMDNNDFKSEFVNRFAEYLNTIFNPDTVIHVIDSLQNNIIYEMFYHNQKWNGIADWNANIEFLRKYARQRPDFVRQHIVNTLGLTGTYKLHITSNIPEAGHLFINNKQIDNNPFDGTYFKDYSINIKPVAKEGYKFLGWYKQTYLKEELIPGQNIDFISSENVNLFAKYQNLGTLPALYFNEFVADNQTGAHDESGISTPWIELYNNCNQIIDIAGLYISNDKNNLTFWQIPSGDLTKTTMGPADFLVLWADGQTNEGILHIPFELSKTGGQLYLTDITGTDTTILDSLTYHAQFSNIACGRFVDGTAGIYFLSSPTPLLPNAAPNQLPKFTSTPIVVAHEQSLYNYNITATDIENDDLDFGHIDLPSWLVLTDNKDGTANLQGIPKVENKGNNPVIITISDGKSLDPVKQLFTIQVQGPLGIDQQTPNKWSVYPNPVKDFVNVIPDAGVKAYGIRISDLSGKIIAQKMNIIGSHNVDFSGYPGGVYFLITSIGQDTYITKLIKSE